MPFVDGDNKRSKPNRLLLWTMVLLALALVFAAYFQPGLMVSLSEQIWACF
ncbi:hypothetical protein WG899_03185 [Paucibacter sp. AS339]|uniref:hypothetical protein n=1 Tax=Paucibacter hankyongi TaxID=3133434 RepID=UPI0030B74014